MAHFAKIVDNTVEEVIVVSNDNCGGGNFPESEPIGQAFIASLGIDGYWLQTSYSASFRNLYAGIGDTFDASMGEYGSFLEPFIPEPEPTPQPQTEPEIETAQTENGN